ALVARLAALPEVDEVQGGSQWVDGLAQFRRLFQGVGLVIGAEHEAAAIVALATLEFAYAVAVPRLEPLLPVTIGLERVAFLSPVQALALIGAGTMLGAIGGLLARGRVPA